MLVTILLIFSRCKINGKLSLTCSYFFMKVKVTCSLTDIAVVHFLKIPLGQNPFRLMTDDDVEIFDLKELQRLMKGIISGPIPFFVKSRILPKFLFNFLLPYF